METERKVKKSGKIKKSDFRFNIKDVPFGRKLSHLYLQEAISKTETGAERKQFQLCRSTKRYATSGEGTEDISPMALRPMYEGRTIPYTSRATPSMLEMNTEYGYIQFCFDQKDLLRIRGKGIDLRLFSEIRPGEAFFSRLDGTYQASFENMGEYLLVPIKGDFDFDCEWQWRTYSSEDAVMDISPDESGEFDLAIHFSIADTERLSKYRPFEDCVEEVQKDYDEWLSIYPPVPAKYERMKKLSAYSVWICYLSPLGLLTENIMQFTKDNGAFSWHQAYFAMSAMNDVDMSVKALRGMFYYQDEYGEIPDIIDDLHVNFLATKPPFQGFVLVYMLDHFGDKMTKEHCDLLYEPLANWYNWWMTRRDTDNNGVPQYNHGCESGNDYTMIMSKGSPAEAPDLMAYLIMLAEGLSRLAEKLGKRKEKKEWEDRSQKLLTVLTTDFWDGDKFIARVSGSHEIIEIDEIDGYIPMMLGKRLPSDIVDKLVKDLSDPDKYYTPFGFRNVPKVFVDGAGQPGIVGGFAPVKIIPGLVEAGKKELARKLLTGFCDMNADGFPDFMFREADAQGIGFGKCSALSCSIFLAMAGYLFEISKEE